MWLIFAILSNTLFGLTNIFDKFFNTKKIKSAYSFAFLLNFAFFFIYLTSLFFVKDKLVFGRVIVQASISGVFWFLMWIFLFKAMQKGEASRVSAIFFTQPVFSALIAVLFLNEKLSLVDWLGILMIVVGAFMVTWERKSREKIVNIAYIYALIAAVLSSTGNAVAKDAMVTMSSVALNAISFFAAVPLYFLLLINKDVLREVRANIKDGKTMLLFFIRSIIGYVGLLSLLVALKIGSLSIVSAISGTQPLFVLSMSILFSIFAPKVVHESVDSKTISKKLLAIVLIVAGAISISFF